MPVRKIFGRKRKGVALEWTQRYAEAEGKIYFSASKYWIAQSICVELAVRQVMTNFGNEFGEMPSSEYDIEVSVTGDKIKVTLNDKKEVT